MGSYNDEIKLNVEEAINHLQAAKDLLEKRSTRYCRCPRDLSPRSILPGPFYWMKISNRDQQGDVISLIQEDFRPGAGG